MYDNILIPTECSGFDREAVRVAVRLANRSTARIHLVRVFSPAGRYGLGTLAEASVASPDAIQHELDIALHELSGLASECRSQGDGRVIVSLQTGPIADSLEAYAIENGIELVVISSHSRGGFSRLTLGSVTDALIRRLTIPVLVVKPPTSYLDPKGVEMFRRIVVPLDGSPTAEQILARVMRLASIEDAEVKLLYVVKGSAGETSDPAAIKAGPEKEMDSARAYLFRLAATLRQEGISATFDVVAGENVAEEICVYSTGERADLIAIATRGRGGLARVLHGSVADAVTRSSRVSVLVFHPTPPKRAAVKATVSSLASPSICHR